MEQFGRDALLTLGWALVGALSMALAFGIFLKIFAWFTPINEWEEIKKGNVAAALIVAAGLIAMGIVVGAAISPSGTAAQP